MDSYVEIQTVADEIARHCDYDDPICSAKREALEWVLGEGDPPLTILNMAALSNLKSRYASV